MQLIFATNNPHKLQELRQIAGDKLEILSLAEIGCSEEIPETGHTLKENALQKARYVHEKYGRACFADDTGLEVDALGGEPGVYSARWAAMAYGLEHTDADKNVSLLLERLQGKADRSARFRTVIAFITEDGREYTVEGVVEGSISTQRHGEGGFGYDPVFVPKGWTQTFAQASAREKNAVSHRGRASMAFGALLRELGMI
ncbi:MAG: RdgB/HAM1 family non-canonical purine NTP pyrophosphatase [Clostridium sp.]|nr:RdgB/HAM1 family non-canonical purine NTP pyrophosphatase [Clostridium sp.]